MNLILINRRFSKTDKVRYCNVNEYLLLKITGEWAVQRAPINVRKIAYCSVGIMKHTVLSAKRNGVLEEDGTKDSMFHATKAAIFNFSHFYWCSIPNSVSLIYIIMCKWYFLLRSLNVKEVYNRKSYEYFELWKNMY